MKTAAMILAGRMATPPEQAWLDLSPGHQLGLGWSRTEDGQASRPARTGLDPAAIVDLNGRDRRGPRVRRNRLGGVKHHPGMQLGSLAGWWRRQTAPAPAANEPGRLSAIQLQSFSTVMYQPTLSAGAAVKCAWPVPAWWVAAGKPWVNPHR